MCFVVNGLLYLNSTLKGKTMHHVYGRLKKKDVEKDMWLKRYTNDLKNKANT